MLSNPSASSHTHPYLMPTLTLLPHNSSKHIQAPMPTLSVYPPAIHTHLNSRNYRHFTNTHICIPTQNSQSIHALMTTHSFSHTPNLMPTLNLLHPPQQFKTHRRPHAHP